MHRQHKFEIKEIIKCLGVYMDPKQIKINNFFIRSLKRMVPIQVLLIAHYSLLYAYCIYVVFAWGHSAHSKRVFGL